MELALLTPLLIIVILLIAQFTMVYFAHEVALAAAQDGARVARADRTGGWSGAAYTRATVAVKHYGPTLIGNLNVAVGGDQNQRWVQVDGEAVHIIPFISVAVHERSGGPIECFRPDVGAGTDCGIRP
jgi:TadE-like protein